VVAGGIALGMHVTPPRFLPIELGGAFLPPRTSGTPGASFFLNWVSLALCALDLKRGDNGLRICAGGAIGALVADPAGLSSAPREDRVVFYADGVLRYQRRIVGPLAVSAGLGMLVPTERAVFYYMDASGKHRDVFQQGPIAGTLDLSVGLCAP
jgi:hypothetical protein